MGLKKCRDNSWIASTFSNWYGLVQFIGDLLTNVKEIPKIDLEPVKRFKNGL